MENWRGLVFNILVKASVGLAAVFTIVVGFAYLLQSSREFHDVVIDASDYSIRGEVSQGTYLGGRWVIFVHGNRKVGIAHPLYQAILQNLDESVSVVGIDMRGYGASSAEGMAGADRILDREEDIIATATWIKHEFGASENQIVLIGHSLGALQVLNAAGNADYGGVISIGPGAFEQFVNNPNARREYIAKIERNTGVRMSPEILMKDAELLMLPNIFTPCPTGNITVIHGAKEKNMLNSRRADVPAACIEKIGWQSIPFSDHMYGSESQMVKPLADIYSLLARSLLMWQLNRSLLTSVNSEN